MTQEKVEPSTDSKESERFHQQDDIKGWEASANVIDQVEFIKKRLPHLSRPVKLEEGPPPRLSRLNIFIISGIVGAFLIWGSITPIVEVAVAPGNVVPDSFVKSVQHFEGGIIQEIFVEDGNVVKENQPLIKLDGSSALSELAQLKARETALKIRAERLRAFGLNQKPDFEQFDKEYQGLIDDQRSIFDMQSKNRNDQHTVITKQIDQKKSQLTLHLGRLKDMEHRTEVLTKQRDVIHNLYEKRLKTGTEYRASEDALAEVLVDLNQSKHQIQEIQQGIAEQESRLLELDTRLRNDALIEMGNVTTELAEIAESKIKLEDRVERLTIRAPAAGVVKGLKHTTLNGVIQAGMEIMQIVPFDRVEVEAHVDPKDIGRLKEGQNVLLKFTAYDYARYGGVNGKVKSVSATTFVDEKGNSYFRVLVSLSKFYVGENQKHHILPGMVVQADIETDKKTLLQYFFKPIYMAFHDAFHEH